ncbi:MAG: putative toxin-antitoxin system toxin component, PIN family [Mariprofundaceae bacterium]|nr:putative toxin-antitoxin system toxin component, PIN family [Mariprofundaceae bacterium]
MSLRIVFDTNTVISALLFEKGQLAWLRDYWRRGEHQFLISRSSVQELIRVLAYPKFGLNKQEIEAILGDYLPYTETVDLPAKLPKLPQCRNASDQMFIELAFIGKADVLVSGDADLLEMAGACPFNIESPAQFAERFSTK